MLAPVYNWFTEDFDTRDLKHAKALLLECLRDAQALWISLSITCRELGTDTAVEYLMPSGTNMRYFCSPQHTDSALFPIIGQMERAARFVHHDAAEAKLDKLDAVLANSLHHPSKPRYLRQGHLRLARSSTEDARAAITEV